MVRRFAFRVRQEVAPPAAAQSAGTLAPSLGKLTTFTPSYRSRFELPRENSVFFKDVDRSATKNEIKSALLDIAATNGEILSKSRADSLADKFKRGEFDPMLARFIQYTDNTGEEAAANVDAERLAA